MDTPRCLMLCLLLSACGQAVSPFVTVTLEGHTPGAELRGTAVLRGPAGEQRQTFSIAGSPFGLRLPEGAQGTLSLRVEQVRGACVLRSGEGSATVEPLSRAELQLAVRRPVLVPAPKAVLERRGTFRGVWGSGAGELWLVGERYATMMESRAMVLRGADAAEPGWDSRPASFVTSGVGVFGLFGISAQDVVAVGVYGQILRGSPQQGGWDMAAVGGLRTGVWAAGPQDIWVVGENFPMEISNSNLVHYDASKRWQPVASEFPKAFLNGIYGASAQDIWVVGNGGVLGHYDGARWRLVPSGAAANLYAISGTGPRDIWVVGDGGIILRYDGAAWAPVPYPRASRLNGVVSLGAEDVWICGAGGVVLRGGAGGFETISSGTDRDLYSIFSTCPSSVWAAGDQGTVVRFQ